MGFFGDQQGGGDPTTSWKPHNIGDMVVGEILDVRPGVAKNYQEDGKGGDKTFADGTPVPQLMIVIQGTPDNWASATRPLTGDDGQALQDDGRRAVYAEKNTNISFAIGDALAEHSLQDVEVGASLWVRWADNGKSNKGYTFRKYEAGYKPAPARSEFGFDQSPPQAPQQQQQQAPPYGGGPTQPVQQEFAQGNTPQTMGLPPQQAPQQAPQAPQQFPADPPF